MKSTVRILYYYSHAHFDTGSPKALVAMIDLLDRERYEPLFLASKDGCLLSELANRGVKIIRGNVTRITLLTLLNDLKGTVALAQELLNLRVNILHVNEFGENLDLVYAARLAGIPVILHVHNPGNIELYNLHWYAASKVIFPSRHALSAVNRFFLIRGKERLVFNSLEWNKITQGRSIRPLLGIEPDDFVVGTIGQLTQEKGTDIAIRTAELLQVEFGSRLHLLFAGRVGEGADAYVEGLKQRVKEGPLADQVHFLGVRDDIPNLLASMDLFFLPTRAEIFCVAALEALACGLPVVARHVGALSELIPSHDCGSLLDSDDPVDFARVISSILVSEDRGYAIGQRARASLVGRLDRAVCARQLAEVYESVL